MYLNLSQLKARARINAEQQFIPRKHGAMDMRTILYKVEHQQSPVLSQLKAKSIA
jgi:hypothetical protein